MLFKRLCDLLEEAGAVATFDPERNNTHPCVQCGTKPTETRGHTLVKVGEYTDAAEVARKGRDVVRPLCDTCRGTRPNYYGGAR